MAHVLVNETRYSVDFDYDPDLGSSARWATRGWVPACPQCGERLLKYDDVDGTTPQHGSHPGGGVGIVCETCDHILEVRS